MPGFSKFKEIFGSESVEFDVDRISAGYGHCGVQGRAQGNEREVELNVKGSRIDFYSFGAQDTHVRSHFVSSNTHVWGAQRIVEDGDHGFVAFVTCFGVVVTSCDENKCGQEAKQVADFHFEKRFRSNGLRGERRR